MIQGEIQTFPFPDLIRWLAMTRRTGELTMVQGAHRLKFYFDQGKLAASSSSEPVESDNSNHVRAALAAAVVLNWGYFVFRDAPLPAEIAAANLRLITETLLLEAISLVDQSRKALVESGADNWAESNGHSQTFTQADDLRLQIVDRLLKEDFRVPPMPHLAVRVLELTRDENFSLRSLGNLILTDQAIAAQILRFANSASQGARRVVDTLPVAVQRLGSDEVINIVLMASLQVKGSKPDIFAAHKRQLWMRSAASAFFARAIAAKVHLDHNLAFLCGLLMDFGMNVLYTLIQEMLNRGSTEGNMPKQVIANIVQDYHSRIGRVVGEKWRLPEPVVAAMAYHHCVETANANREYVATAALADSLACFALSQPRAELEQAVAAQLPEKLASHPAALLLPLNLRGAGEILAELPHQLDQALALVLD